MKKSKNSTQKKKFKKYWDLRGGCQEIVEFHAKDEFEEILGVESMGQEIEEIPGITIELNRFVIHIRLLQFFTYILLLT